MGISRRDVLLQGAVIGAGVISSGIPSMEALAAGQPPERRTLQGLAWNDPIVSTYRDAVGQLKQRPASNKISWAGLAGIHGTDPGAYHFCPHGNWYFLPWHRAYTLTYERVIRDLTGNNDFALPYWDWTTNPTMPEVFLSPTTPDGKKNWLFVNDQDFGQPWKRTWPKTKPMPANIVGPAILQTILNATDYEEFGTSRPQDQDSLDPSWVLSGTGVQGTLEQTPHNLVHNNIGGWMPSALSPRDPIFFMHHCNIDRIWAVWNSLGNANSAESLWTDMVFTNNFINTDGTPYSPKVTDLFDPETLGYTYGLAPPVTAQTGSSPNFLALQNKLTTLRSPGKAAAPADIRTYSVTPGQAAGTATKPLSVTVKADPALIAAVLKRKPVSSGSEFLSFSAAREVRATGTRVLAFVRDVAVTDPKSTEFRVFLDHPDLTAQASVTDPSYVGSFGVFVHGGHAGHAATNPSFVLDLTSAIQRVYGSGAPPAGGINLQFIPVTSNANGPVGSIRPGKVEVAFLNG
jgi:tyrosinase